MHDVRTKDKRQSSGRSSLNRGERLHLLIIRFQEQEKIASLMVAVLVVGIGIGSALSYPVVNLL